MKLVILMKNQSKYYNKNAKKYAEMESIILNTNVMMGIFNQEMVVIKIAKLKKDLNVLMIIALIQIQKVNLNMSSLMTIFT